MAPYFLFLGVSIRNFIFSKQSQLNQERTRQRRLKKIVKYAKKHSELYKELYKDVDVNNFELKDLPITTKSMFTDNFQKWLTVNDINDSELNLFLDNKDNVGNLLNNKYAVYKTSGTTGKQLVVLEDAHSQNITIGTGSIKNWPGGIKTFIKIWKQCNHNVKVAIVSAYSIFGIVPYMAINFKKHIPKSIQKNIIFIDIDEGVDEIAKKLMKQQTDLLIVYPTVLSMLEKKQRNKEMFIQPKLIATVGEKLSQQLRDDCTETFKSNVCTSYACTETGNITHECPQCHRQHLNTDYLFIEPVDNDYNPVPFGTLSDKVLVTNLGNRVQPFIRYELNDRIIVHDEPCGCGDKSPWIEIEGRSGEILHFTDVDGKEVGVFPISFLAIVMNASTKIELYQFFISKNNEIEVRLKLQGNTNKKKVFEKIKKEILKLLLELNVYNPQIVLSNKEPEFEKSGKFKEYKQYTD